MNIKLKNSKVQKFQMGGPMPQEAPVEKPVQEGSASMQEQAPEQEEKPVRKRRTVKKKKEEGEDDKAA